MEKRFGILQPIDSVASDRSCSNENQERFRRSEQEQNGVARNAGPNEEEKINQGHGFQAPIHDASLIVEEDSKQ